MSEEGKTSVFEGAEVWSISDIDEGTWEKSIVRDIGHIGEIGGKLDVHVEIDGEQQIIKTKYEDDSVNEYQHVKPRSTVSYENVKDIDLPALYVINEPEVLECLRFCHSQFVQYLSIGPLLVWINRFDVTSNDFNDKLYSTYYFEKDAKKDILNPAKPSAINSLYRKLLKLRPETLEEDRANQAVIMLGESGSGKSRAVRDICNHIAYITSKKLNQVPYGDDEFQPDVPFFNRINTILESFGHCQTARNTNSSRFSKSVKISFNEENGHINGIIFRCFHLELDRLTSQGNKESNYKIFYDIFDDIYFASQAMSRYGIDNMTMFRMTSTRPNTPFLPGRSSFKDLSSALEEVARIPRSKQNVMFGLLAGILHLGEVEMEECDNYGDVSTVMSSDPVSIDHMNRVLKLLGITLEALLGVVSKRQLNFAGNIVEKNLDLNESLGAKDTFICQVYAALFRWMVSKMNEGIAAKFSSKPEVVETPSPPRRRNPFAEVEEPAESEDVFGEREEDAPTPKNTFSIYDIVGFENLERNTLEQLCVNYANERVFQYLNQMVFVIDKELFFTERLFVSTSHFFDNALTIRLLDSKSNGIFTICDDQLKLKSSTSDEKLSSILYAQHSNNKMFIASRAEHKNFEFIVKHYTNLVKYEIIGFTNANKIEPAQEILECLQSSSIPFIQEELAPFCDIRTLSNSASHLSGLSPKPSVELTASLMSQKSSRNLGLDRAPSLRGPGAFERSPSARGPNAFNKSPSFRGAQSFDSPSTPPNRRDMFKRAASAHPSMNQGVSPFGSGNRGRTGSGGKPSKPNTLTSLTVLQLTEIMAEVKAAETSFHLCIRPNDTTFPNSFDQRAVCRQVRPYGIVNILSFYKQTYPYRTDHISFVNRYSPLAVFCKNSDKESADFMTALWTVRSLGLKLDKRNKDQWTELSHSLVSLLPDVPELEDLCRVLSGSTEAVSSPLELITSGIRVGEKYVMMNALAYFYLNEARQMAVKLIGKIIWRAYKHKRDGLTNGSATLIGSIVRMHIAKRKAESIRMRDTVIMVQSLVRRYLVRRRQFRGELLIDGVNRDEIVAEKLVKAQAVWRGSFTRKKLAQLKLQKEDSGLSVGGDSLRQNEGNICIEEMSMPEESVQATHRDDDMSLEPIKIASRGDDVQSEMSYVSDPLRNSGAFAASGSQSNAQLAKLRELQATIESLELENSRLKRKLQATEYEDFKEKDIGDDDGVDISPSRKLVTKQSSVGSYTPNSVYGGHVDSPFDSGAPDLKAPEYESYVSRTLKALENDLSYLLEPTPFWKFGRNGNVRKTMLVVSPDFQFLCWKPRNGLLKSSKETRVDLRLVWRLVSGQSTPPFEAYKGVTHGTMPPSRSFSLVYGFRSLDLCACDDETYDDWFTGLRYILQLFNGDVQEAGLDRQLLRRKWNFLDTKGYGFLSRKEVIHLVSNLGVRFDRSSFTAALLRSTIGNSTHDEITFSQFDSLVYQLRRRPDLEILWSKILVGYDFSRDVFPLHVDGDLDTAILHEVIGVPTFKHFWKLSQGRALHDDEAVQMMAEGMGEMHQEDFPVLSYNGFVNLMTHPKNDAYNPVSVMLSAKDMSHPLQHYYIATSDGPSLHPHKRAGDEDEDDETAALAEGNSYANAILSGCRALELRCYEERVNPKGIDTDVYVGRDRGEFRMTFKETLLHIHRVAFKTSPFPLIMMLEMNADLAQQKRCAKLLKKIFGDAIYTPAEVQGSMLPSPNELRNRVIIFLTHRKRDIHGAYKVDNAHNSSVMSLPMGDLGSFMSPGMSSKMSNDDDDDFGEDVKLVDEDIVDDVEGDDVLNGAMATPLRTVSSDRNSPSVSKRDYHIVDPESKFKRSGTMDQSAVDVLAKCQGVYPSLMRLCHYSHGLRIGSHSVRDMLARLAENPEAEGALVKYNMKRFSYIYMDRTTKSFGSYGGMVRAWDCGASFVSACHDEPSLGTKINHGRFRSNGGCGYVLKHVRYRSPREYLPPAPHILSLHVISGRDLIVHVPKAKNDSFLNQSSDSLDQSRNPSVRETDLSSTKPRRVKDKGLSVVVDLNGLSCEDIQQKTRAIKKHGASPFWNEVFSFSLKDATIGQITLRVFSNDMCTGFVSIPLAHLRSGYRTLALYEEKEENNHVASPMDMSSLFVRVKFDSLTDFNTYSQADLPAAYTEAENLKLMNGVKASDIPNGSIPRRNTDGSEYSPARPSARHKLRTSSDANAESGSPMGSRLSGSFHRSPSKDAMSPVHHSRSLDRNSLRDRDGYRRSKSRDDRDYRRSSSSRDRDRDDKYRRSSSRGDRDLERRHSRDYRRSSSRSPSKDPERRRSSSSRDRDDKYRRSSSRGDRDLERRHSSEYRRSSSRGDRDKRIDRRHSSGDNHRGSSSRDRDDKYRRSSSSRSDRDRHSRSSGDIKRDRDRESGRRHHSSSDVFESSNRRSSRRSSRDGNGLQKLPSVVENDAEHHDTDDLDIAQGDMGNGAIETYDSDSPLKHELNELRLSPKHPSSRSPQSGGDDGEDQYSVGRKVNEVDYQSGDDDGANDPWTPPV